MRLVQNLCFFFVAFGWTFFFWKARVSTESLTGVSQYLAFLRAPIDTQFLSEN